MRRILSMLLAAALPATLAVVRSEPSVAAEYAGSFEIGSGAYDDLKIDQERARIYTVIGSSLTIFDIDTHDVVGRVPVRGARALAFDPDEDRILVTTAGYLEVIDAETLAKTTVALGSGDPTDIETDPLTGDIFVIDRTRDRVQVVRGGVVADDVAVGRNPLYASFDPTHRRLWVPTLGGVNYGDEQLHVIDVDSMETLEVLPYLGARNVLADAASGRVFVPNYAHGWLSVYDSDTMIEQQRIWLREQSMCCANHMSFDPVRQRLFLYGGSVEVDLSTGIATLESLPPWPGERGAIFLETGDLYQVSGTQIKIIASDLPDATIIATPRTGASIGTSFLDAWWTNQDWQVALACVTACSGIEYRINGGAPAVYATPIAFSTEGDHLLEFRRLGAGESYRGVVYRVDRTAPDGRHELSNYGRSNGTWGTNSWKIVQDCANVVGGDRRAVCFSQLLFENGYVSWSATPVIAGEGLHHVTTWSVDPAGNIAPSTTYDLGVDTTPPVRTVNPVPVGPVTDGWAAAWDVTLGCNDPLAGSQPGASGCADISYRVDGGAWTIYAGPVHLDTDGIHVLEHRILDRVNNGTPGSITLRVDRTAPATAAVSGDDADVRDGWSNGTSVAFVCSDAGSGCASTTYTRSGSGPQTYSAPIALSLTEENRFEVHSTDGVNNLEESRVVSISVDQAAPTLTVTSEPLEGSAGGWRVRAACTDASSSAMPASGCLTPTYRIGASAWSAVPEDGIEISADGAHVIDLRTQDLAENIDDEQVLLSVDATEPATAMHATYEPGGTRIELRCTDPSTGSSPWASGCAQTMMRATRDGTPKGAFEPYDGPFLLDVDGGYEIEFSSTDVAGNIEPQRSATLYVDRVAPNARMLTPNGTIASSRAPLQFIATADDPVGPGGAASGVARACFEVTRADGSIASPCVRPIVVAENVWRGSVALPAGSYGVTWTVWDGNENQTRTQPITVTVI